MASRYVILSTTHPTYEIIIDTLTSLSVDKGVNFKPRLSVDGTKALIQIKDVVELPENFNLAGVDAENDTADTDEKWARDTVRANSAVWIKRVGM